MGRGKCYNCLLCTAFINFIGVFGDIRLRMSEFAVSAF